VALLSDLSLRERLWYHAYRFRRAATAPLASLGRDPADARIALVTSAGLHQPADSPFVPEKGGDWSYRVIPGTIATSALVCTHPSRAWDRSGVEQDANVAFPLDRLRELAGDGTIGNCAPRHISFQGSITAPGRLVSRTAPEIADIFRNDQVDGVVLAPV
jgi:D-proline reductase (dithiol) PrdB